MDFESYLDGLRRAGELLAAAARRADPAARPPGCPEWDVTDVVRHTGMVHRWGVLVLRERRTEHGPDDPDTGAGLTGAALADWYAAGHAAFVAELLRTDPAAEVFTLLPAASARDFWARRQLHEAAIHRADVEAATVEGAAAVTPYRPDAAVDGMDEALALGGRPLRRWTGPDKVLRLVPADADAPRTVRVGTDGARPADETEARADCVVRASAGDLFLLLWNRPTTGPLDVTGDHTVLDAWAGAVRNRWHSTFPDPPPGD